MNDWAASLIGAPYRSGAVGPDEFDCIGLVRYYFKHRHGIELPDYNLAKGSRQELLAFVKATRWRRAAGPAQHEDIITMENFVGRHVGVALKTCEGLGLLHAQGNDLKGSVVWQPLNSLVAYRKLELWRHQ